MKKLVVLFVCMGVFIGCSEEKKKSNKPQGAMAHSVGRMNELSVVINNDLWKGKVGDTIRKYFGAEVPGLPQQEPLFSMRQMPSHAFSGMARKNRTFLQISKGKTTGYKQLQNKYATPQMGAVISGTTEEELIKVLLDNQSQIIADYKNTEIREKQNRIRKSLEKIPQLKEKFGITLQMPTAYRVAKEEEDFIWFRKDIPNGDMNLMVYELPSGTIPKDSSTVATIIKVRDSVGGLKIPTSSGKFITEEAYAPYLYETKLDGKFAFETKGIWEIKDRFMSGPFVNYIIEDSNNQRQLVIEGFVLAPSVRKRDNMFELEAIMKTLKFE